MTVPSSTSRDQQAGNGVTTDFTVPFRILDQTHIRVLLTVAGVTTEQVLTTNYTVSGVGGASTTVTFLVAPPSGSTVTFLRNVPMTQETDYVPNDPFPAESHERALDKLTMIVQQLDEGLDRAMTLPGQVSGVSTELPAPSPNTIFGWNPGGTAIQNFPLSTIATSIVYGNKVYQTFAGTGAQVDFTLLQDPGSLGNLDVSIDGVTQVPGSDYTYATTTLTFAVAPANLAVILVRYDQALPTGVTDAAAVNYADPVAPAILKTLSDIRNGDPVSVLRAIPPSRYAAIFAGTDTVDSAAAINSLLTDMAAVGRGHLVHEHGTLWIASQLNVPADVMFTGGGVKSVIKPLAAMTSMISMNGDYAQVRDLNLQNESSRASRGITVASPFFAKVLDNYLGSLPAGVYIDGAQKGWVERNHMLNCDFGIFSADDGREFRLIGNHVQGGTGIWITQSTQQAEGVKIAFNTILPSVTSDPNSGHGLVIEAGLEMQIIANMFGNCDKNGILLAATGGNAIAAVKIAHGWCDNDTGTANSEGLFVYGNVGDVTVEDYTFANANQRGVHIGLTAETAPQRIDLKNLKFLNNGSGDIRIEKGVDIRVAECRFQHATENLREDVNTITSRVYENTFIVAPAPKSTGSRFYDNNGPSGVNDDNGVYTPTLTNTANVNMGSTVAYDTTYSRTGDTVTVSGRVDITPTAAAGAITQLRMTLPKTSNFTGQTSLAGTACAILSGASMIPGTLSADPANDDATLTFFASSTAQHLFFFTYTYRVL